MVNLQGVWTFAAVLAVVLHGPSVLGGFDDRLVDSSLALEFLFEQTASPLLDTYPSGIYDSQNVGSPAKTTTWNQPVNAGANVQFLNPGVYITESSGSGALPPIGELSTNSEYMSDLKDDMLNNKGFTMEAWIKVDSLSETGTIVDTPFNSAGYLCGLVNNLRVTSFQQTTSNISFIVSNNPGGGTSVCISCTAPIPENVEYLHIVGVGPDNFGESYAFYVNGVAVSCAATLASFTTYSWNSLTLLQFGSANNNNDRWTGSMFLFAMYVKELTPAQITTNFLAGPFPFTPVIQSSILTVVEDAYNPICFNVTDPWETTFTYTVMAVPASGSLYTLVGSSYTLVVAYPFSTTDDCVYYYSSAHGSALAVLSYYVTDTDDLQSSTQTITLNVIESPSFLDPSSWTVPVAAIDVDFAASSTNLDGISLNNDDSAEVVEVTLWSEEGLLSLAGVGVVFSVGDGQGDTAMVFQGTTAAVNAALATLEYSGLNGYVATDVVHASVREALGIVQSPPISINILNACVS